MPGEGLGAEHGHGLSLALLFPEWKQVSVSYPLGTNPIKVGPAGKGSYKARWPEELVGPGAGWTRKVDQTQPRGSHSGCARAVCAGHPARAQCVLCPVRLDHLRPPRLQQKKELPVPEDPPSKLPCSTPYAAFLPLTAPCHLAKWARLAHTATAFTNSPTQELTGDP